MSAQMWQTLAGSIIVNIVVQGFASRTKLPVWVQMLSGFAMFTGIRLIALGVSG